MNIIARSLFTVLALCLTVGGAHASQQTVKFLNDNEMSAAKGGFCPFEECETGAGTGVCQVIPPDGLCALTICKYSHETVGGLEVLNCGFVGKYTCSELTTYRQCILAFTLNFCSNGPDTLHCGVIIEPECHIEYPDRICTCGICDTKVPCDWTNCVEGL